jgi:hypothetical protein
MRAPSPSRSPRGYERLDPVGLREPWLRLCAAMPSSEAFSACPLKAVGMAPRQEAWSKGRFERLSGSFRSAKFGKNRRFGKAGAALRGPVGPNPQTA